MKLRKQGRCGNGLAVAAGLGLLVCLGLMSARHGWAQAPASADTAKTAEQAFKNIQVLKGVPADQIIPAMQFITASLGVECDYCHVQGQFEKDEKKPKETARKMMTMMFAINKENFEGHREVTCYSCHRGSAEPVGTPIISDEEPKPGMKDEAKTGEAAALPKAEEILDKYVQALGGAAALDKVSSRVIKGAALMPGGMKAPVDVYAKGPDKRVSIMHLPNGDSITAFDGQGGWLGAPGRPVRDMNNGEAEGARIDADLHLATDLKQMFKEFRVRTGDKIGEHDTYLVVGVREGKPPLRLYFDQKSGLLLRLSRYAETPLGRNPTQVDYADYRDLDGVKFPFRWTVARPSGRFTIQAEQVQQNVPVEDGKFEKPGQ
jgi:hypothetical protein